MEIAAAAEAERVGSKKRPKSTKKIFTAPPFAPPPTLSDDEWRVARSKHARKHSKCKLRRRIKRAPLEKEWIRLQADIAKFGPEKAAVLATKRAAAKLAREEKKKRSDAAPAKKKYKPPRVAAGQRLDYPDFWTEASEGFRGAIWIPVDMVDIGTNETAPTWFSTRTLHPWQTNHTSESQAAMAARTCAAIRARIEAEKQAEAMRSAANRTESWRKANAKRVTDGDPEVPYRDPEPPGPPTKCKVYNLLPTESQKKTLSTWLGGARHAYNRAVDVLNADPEKRFDKPSLCHRAGVDDGGRMVATGATTAGGRKTRAKSACAQNPWQAHAPPELHEVPSKIRTNAVRDLTKACESLVAKKTEGAKVTRKFKHRTSSDRSQSFALESEKQLNAKTERSLYAAIFGTQEDRSRMACKGGERLPESIDADCRVVYKRLKREWQLPVPIPIERRARAAEAANVVAIDPGIRTFATCYDLGNMQIVEWGCKGDETRGKRARREFGGTELIDWLCRKTARLEKRSATAPNARKKKNLHRAANRVRDKIRRLVDEFHHKLALWLCANYDVVLLPEFGVKGVSRKKGLQRGKHRILGTAAVRKLAQLSHYRFREFLLHKAREYGTEVVVCDEYWTSKACVKCGRLDHDLGAKKVYECAHCKSAHDRDAGAAQNILKRYVAMRKLEVGKGAEKCQGMCAQAAAAAAAAAAHARATGPSGPVAEPSIGQK
jgi:putative transposase